MDFIPEIKGLSLMAIGPNAPDPDADDEEEEFTEDEEDTIASLRKAIGDDSPPPFEAIRNRIQEDPDDEPKSKNAEG